MQSLIGSYPFPPWPGAILLTPSFGTLVIDATGEKAAFIIEAPKTGTLAKVGFSINTLTLADDLKISFQDVDLATGDPDGGVDQFRVMTAASLSAGTMLLTGLITDTGADGGAKRSVTIGDLLAVVIEFDTYVDGNLRIATFADDTNDFPYATLFTSSWAKASAAAPILYLEYDDGSTAPIAGCWPIAVIDSTTYNNGSAADEKALKFTLPYPARAVGFWLWAELDGDADIVLYEGTTALATKSSDKEVRRSTAAGFLIKKFAAPVSLTKDTTYYLSLKPTSATNVALQIGDLEVAARLNALPGGADFCLATRVDAGAWSNVTTKKPFMGLLLDQGDDAVGGGGGGAVIGGIKVINPGSIIL